MAGYRVTVYRRNIVSLIQVGSGNRWIHSKAKEIERAARRIAPKRTGRLRASHVTLPSTGTNQYVKRYRVSAQAYYAAWVHEGVPGRIYPKNGKALAIPRSRTKPPWNAGRGKVILKRSVRGQSANPWLARAAAMVV